MIYVVDDDAHKSDGLKLLLEFRGFESSFIPDADLAWGVLTTSPIKSGDLIVLDLFLPAGSGDWSGATTSTLPPNSLNGWRLAEALLHFDHPKFAGRLAFYTAYLGENWELAEWAAENRIPIILKTMQIEALLNAITSLTRTDSALS